MAQFSFLSEQSDENQRAFEIPGGEHVSDPVAVLAPAEKSSYSCTLPGSTGARMVT